VQTVYGHSVSKTAAKNLGSLTIFYAAPAALQAKLKAEMLDLCPPAAATSECSLAHLDKLCKSLVGGVLLVVKCWDKQKAAFGFGEPVLQVVANPAASSLGAFNDASNSLGVNLGEVWDFSSSPFDQFPFNDSTCPMMVSTRGYSRKEKHAIAGYLKSTGPLFIPRGKHVAGVVNVIPTLPVNRAVFLPAACDLSLRMFWKLDGLKLSILIESIRVNTVNSQTEHICRQTK
jgi:hypothetical protein